MAGKRDEVFLLGEEEVGSDPWSAPEEEPITATPASGLSHPPRLRLRWPLILGALVPVVVLAIVARPGGEGADPGPQRAQAPAVAAPEAESIVRSPRRSDRPRRSPERHSRTHRGERNQAVEGRGEPQPLEEAEGAPVVTYTPAPEPAPEEAAAAPSQAAPLPAARPEFGIER